MVSKAAAKKPEILMIHCILRCRSPPADFLRRRRRGLKSKRSARRRNPSVVPFTTASVVGGGGGDCKEAVMVSPGLQGLDRLGSKQSRRESKEKPVGGLTTPITALAVRFSALNSSFSSLFFRASAPLWSSSSSSAAAANNKTGTYSR